MYAWKPWRFCRVTHNKGDIFSVYVQEAWNVGEAPFDKGRIFVLMLRGVIRGTLDCKHFERSADGKGREVDLSTNPWVEPRRSPAKVHHLRRRFFRDLGDKLGSRASIPDDSNPLVPQVNGVIPFSRMETGAFEIRQSFHIRGRFGGGGK